MRFDTHPLILFNITIMFTNNSMYLHSSVVLFKQGTCAYGIIFKLISINP